MPLDIGAGGSAVASLEIPIVLTGIDAAKAQVAALGATGDQAAGRVTAAFQTAQPAISGASSSAANLVASMQNVAGAANVAGQGVGNLASNLAASASATDTHTLAAGRMIRAFEGLTASATGANREILSITAVLGEFAAGSIPVLAIAAAIGVASLAYETFAGQAAEAQKAQDDLTASLGKWYDEQQRGAGGNFAEQIDAENTAISRLSGTLTGLQSTHSLTGLTEYAKDIVKAFALSDVFDPAAETQKFNDLWTAYIKGVGDSVTKGYAEVAAAAKAGVQALITASNDFAGQQAGSLATIIGAHNTSGTASLASASEIADATALLGKFESALTELQSEYGNLSNAADKAFNLKLQASDIENINRLHDALTALTPAQKANEEAAKSIVDALGQEFDAMVRLAGAPKEDPYHITPGGGTGLAPFAKDIEATTNGLNDLTRNGLPEYSDGLAKSSELAQKASAEAARLSETIGHDLVKAFDDLAQHGSLSFTQLIDDATNLAYHISDLLQKRAAAQVIANGGSPADAGVAAQNASIISPADVKTLGIYSVAANGVGLVVGALNDLFHTAQNTPSSIEKTIEAIASLQATLAAWDASLVANGNSVIGALAANKANADAIIDQANADLPGKHNQTAREQIISGANAAETTANGQTARDFFDSVTAGLEATQGPLGAYTAAMAAAKKTEDDNTASALALGASQSVVDAITQTYTNTVNALTAAYQEGQKQNQAALDARLAAAQGDNTLAAALTRRAAEDKEYFDAQQAGYSAAQLIELRYVQSLEDEAAAKQRLTTATETLASNLAGGPNSTAASRTAADLQPLNDKYVADQQQQATDLARLNDDLGQHYNSLTGEMENNASAAQISADRQALLTDGITTAGDAAAIAAKAFQDAAAAMAQAANDIERDVSGGFITGAAGVAAEASAFGFTGLSDDAIKQLYVPWYPGITAAEEQTDQNITTYFRDKGQFLGGSTSDASASNLTATATAAGASAQTTAVASGASALTEQTGNRMADILEASLITQREIRDRLPDLGSPVVDPASLFMPSSFSNTPSSQRQSVTIPASVPNAPAQLVITVRVVGDGSTTGQQAALDFIRTLKTPAAKKALDDAINEDLAQVLLAKQRADGDNTITGF